jgi:dolichol-phosphate mannosyltransferase
MSTKALGASVIVPTYREAPNIEPLVQRIFAAVAGFAGETELIIVDDDSRDGTEKIVESLRSEYPVRLIVRHEDRGLSSAVIAGFAEAKYDRLVVLDADLQHPPEMIPALLERLDRGDCDFVIGSRYVQGGGIGSDWPFLRRLASRTATLLARPLAPLSDPMSGFFALDRRTWEKAARIDPIGYKIALELYVKGGCRRPAEVPIEFAARHAGQSKLSLGEQVRYLRHLGRLYRFRFPWLAGLLVLVLVILVAAVVLWVSRGP